jgi:hypothetical protein
MIRKSVAWSWVFALLVALLMISNVIMVALLMVALIAEL